MSYIVLLFAHGLVSNWCYSRNNKNLKNKEHTVTCLNEEWEKKISGRTKCSHKWLQLRNQYE
jgi:hypothetical protein